MSGNFRLYLGIGRCELVFVRGGRRYFRFRSDEVRRHRRNGLIVFTVLMGEHCFDVAVDRCRMMAIDKGNVLMLGAMGL